MRYVACAFAVVVAACGGVAGEDPEIDACPTWPSGTAPARGTLVVRAEGGTTPPASELLVGVEAATLTPGQELVTIRACTVAFVEDDPWEPWSFIATYRLAGPIDEPTMIPGATLSGTPGMSGGVSARTLPCDAGCQPEVTDAWLFMQNGAAEIVVDRFALRALSSSGWALTDGAPSRRVDLEIDLTW